MASADGMPGAFDGSLDVEGLVPRLQAQGLEIPRIPPREQGSWIHRNYPVLDARLVVTGLTHGTLPGRIPGHEYAVVPRDGSAARAFRENLETPWQDKELSQP